MLSERTPTRGEAMQALKQSLIETALQHDRVAAFIENLNALLVQFNRPDVQVETRTEISERGVHVEISIRYDSLYPGQAARDPERNQALRQAEIFLLNSLRSAGVNIGQGGSIGSGDVMRNYHSLFDVVVGFDGELYAD